eukprot:3811041-Amphidinium_carterae.2
MHMMSSCRRAAKQRAWRQCCTKNFQPRCWARTRALEDGPTAHSRLEEKLGKSNAQWRALVRTSSRSGLLDIDAGNIPLRSG